MIFMYPKRQCPHKVVSFAPVSPQRIKATEENMKEDPLQRLCRNHMGDLERLQPWFGILTTGLKTPISTRSSKEDSLFQSDKVSGRACGFVQTPDRARQGWTCKEKGPPKKKRICFCKRPP